jgi:branched-chain amino acid transport system permease protein
MKQSAPRWPGARARDKMVRSLAALAICATGGVAVVFALDQAGTDYAFQAAYTVLQFVALATAWNILGGYAGYVNFGVAGFFAVGVYTSVIVYKTVQWPLISTIPLAAVVAGLLGLGMGYLTLRLRGVFFSIATLAFSVVLNTLIVNWAFVGGSRGVYVVHPQSIAFFGS